MQLFKNILVVVDRQIDCSALIERAASLAHTHQSFLTVITFSEKARLSIPTSDISESKDIEEPGINIIEKVSPDASSPFTPESVYDPKQIRDMSDTVSQEVTMTILSNPYMEIQEMIIEEEKEYLEKIIAPIRQAGVQVSGKILNGTPFLEIIREVLRNGHDLVMITAEGGGDFREMLFGSTTMHLMRKCPCPVWVFKPDQAGGYTRIMAAVDPTPHDEARNSLNDKMLELAIWLARSERSELIIVHTWILYGESMLRNSRARLPKHKVDQMVREERDAHKLRLVRLLKKYPLEDLQFKVYMLKGNPGTLIPALAKALGIEFIIMGTVSRTGVAGMLIGNTSEQVLNQVNCAVLTVKPEGFITPVKLDESEQTITQ